MQNDLSRASRRGFFLAATATGAAVAAVTVMKPSQEAPEVQAKLPPPERGGGYTLSEHVKRYYKTTLV